MKYRQYLTYLVTLFFAGLFSCANPTSPTTSQFTVTIKGNVVRKNFTPLDSVQIVTSNPFRRDSSKSDGSFLVSFSSSEKNAVNATMTFSRSGFLDTSLAISYSASTKDINLQAVTMKGVTAAQDSGGQIRTSLRAGAIVYLGSSSPNLSIYGAGGTDAVTLTFEVRDSLGNPVDTSNQTLIYFRFATTPPDSFTQLSRSSAKTNSSGRVTVLLGSGLRAGIASVQAYAAVKRATDTTKVDTITSSIVSIPIFGGFPDSAHFSMSAAKVNIPGAVQAGIHDPITALIGDKYGNPAQPGTIVYFTTTGGIVNPAAAASAEDGTVAVDLITGNPIPPGGIVTVTAQLTTGAGGIAGKIARLVGAKGIAKNLSDGENAYGKYTPRRVKPATKAEQAFRNKRTVVKFVEETNKSNHNISQSHTAAINGEAVVVGSSKSNRKVSQSRVATIDGEAVASSSIAGVFSSSVVVIFSGKTTISTSDTNFVITSGGSRTVNYFVGDLNGNPLTSGSTIQVSVSGTSNVALTGDVNVTLPDVQDNAFTHYRVIAKDNRTTGSNLTETVNLNIAVVSANGNKNLSLNGRLLGGGASDSGKVGRIALVNTATDTVVVSGGGGSSSKQVQFKVFDVFNQPAKNIPINFELTQTVNGGEYLSPLSAVSDTNGNVSTTFTSGIRSGNVQLVARAKQDSAFIISSNVKSIHIKTGPIQSIALINVSSQQLSIRSVGGMESATIVFEGRDSLANAIDFANQTLIRFRLQGDTAGTYVSPNPATTDPVTGRVITTFGSGFTPGVVQVYASAKSDSIKSLPVRFTIASGLPDSAHFTLGPRDHVNYPGVNPSAFATVTVAAGDTFGNPAQIGTSVYFTTNTGIITASGSLDAFGKTAATWNLALNPPPSNGIAFATGRTLNRWGKFVQDTLRVVLSGSPIVSSLDTNFTVAVGSTKQFDFTVSDALLNPLSAGATITVSSSGSGAPDVELSGDISKVMPDTKDKAFTKFHVFVRDTRITSVTKNEPLNLTIDVTGPNGPAELILKGTLLGTGGAGVDSSVAGRIVLQNTTPDTVVVANVGGIKSKDIQFKVYSTFGLPAKNVLVTFSFAKSLGGGEYLSPTTALSDTGGNVRTTITSGTGFGEVRVVATAKRDSLTISSDQKVVYIVIPPSTRLAAQVAYLGATATDIFVDGVGGLENSTISYEVRDSLGIPIDRQRRVGVTYAIQFFPNSTVGGGTPPSIIPSTDSTDDSGQLRTTVVSGTEAGVVQVVAHINVPNRAPVISQPVKISVHAGFPDQAHFSLTASHFVFAGLDFANTIPFSVAVGDTFSNPVAQGTAIYFHSQAGIIQTGSPAYTDLSGTASVNLLTVNPLPLSVPYEYKPVSGPYAALIGGRDGYYWVYAQTQGHFATNVIDSVLVLAVGGPITVTGIPVGIVSIDDTTRISAPISITVKDGHGNPLPDGTTITATIVPPQNPPTGFQIGVVGDISSDLAVQLPNAGYARFPGPGITDFTLRVVNQSTISISGIAVVIRITIISPNIGTSTYSFTAQAQ